jgi:hypothetical protein
VKSKQSIFLAQLRQLGDIRRNPPRLTLAARLRNFEVVD